MSFNGNVTAVIGKDLAGSLGRKGTASDVTLYNYKMQDTVLAFVEPSSYPDKIQSLTSALNIADQVLFKVEAVNQEFAETVMALDALGMTRGYLIAGKDVVADNLKAFTAGTVVSSYPFIEEGVVSIREKLGELRPDASGDAVVQVDHSFNVKGVGTVVLGVVKRGVIKKYDEVTVYPGKKKSTVKSIQVSDTDVADAAAGSRVGLCMKNITPEDVTRGSLVSPSQAIKTASLLEVSAGVSKYSPRAIKKDDVIMVNAHMNYSPAKILEGEVAPGQKGALKLQLEKEVPLLGGRMAFLDPGQKRPRVFGYAEV